MECPFELPVHINKIPCFTEEEVAYIVQAINSYEKLIRVIKETNQCFKCKYGYRTTKITCPGNADAELPCSGFVEEYDGLNYLEQALKEKP